MRFGHSIGQACFWLVVACLGEGIVMGAQSGPSPATAGPIYRLDSGDVLDIRFFYNEEFNTKTQIRPDGKISMPLAGEIEVSGLTIGELTARLGDLYKGTIRRPAITVQVEAFANRKVFVGGEVARPGMFPLVGRQTLAGAIYEAGGMTRSANRSEVTVIRRSGPGTAERIPVSLRDIASRRHDSSPAAMFMLQPLDVVVIHESGVGKANRLVDQYVRQMAPVLLTGGFTYLFNGRLLP